MNNRSFIKFWQVLLSLTIVITTLLISPSLIPSNVQATGQETCPNSGDWVKVDNIDAQSYTYNAPAGKEIVETCYKAGTTLRYANVNPAQGSVTLTTDVSNPNNNAFQDISHASFRLVEIQQEIPTPTPAPAEEKPFVRVTYICQTDIAGIVEGYGLTVNPGDHVWRIRHESGPATNFTTNFLSAVQGYINVGETLFFVTPQSANGVKVITSPLANKYTGTASVSGSICDIPEEPKEESPFVRVTYICQADIAGIVEGYGLTVNPGDHVWRIRHESGPATNFTTNFLSDVQGYINVGETLFFVTPQSANGVKVITTPLGNEYGGTASVSGAVCQIPDEPKENLSLSGECLGDGKLEWTITNPNAQVIPFSWQSQNGESGDGEVSASGYTTFITTSAATQLSLSYVLNDDPGEIAAQVDACEDPKVTVDPQPDPKPDQAAGGMGPSILNTLMPFFLGISGVATVSALAFNAKKKREQ